MSIELWMRKPEFMDFRHSTPISIELANRRDLDTIYLTSGKFSYRHVINPGAYLGTIALSCFRRDFGEISKQLGWPFLLQGVQSGKPPLAHYP